MYLFKTKCVDSFIPACAESRDKIQNKSHWHQLELERKKLFLRATITQ